MKKIFLITSTVIISLSYIIMGTLQVSAHSNLNRLKSNALLTEKNIEKTINEEILAAPIPSPGGKTWYVSIENGKNKNAGTKEAPLKNIQRAINQASDGDVIHVAQGNYVGLMNTGYLTVDKPLSIIGGYNNDFSERDPLQYKTMVQTTPDHSSTSSSKCLINIDFKKGDCMIDGIIMDRGLANGYHPKDGKPEGVATGMYLPPPTTGINHDFVKVFSVSMALLHFNIDEGNVTIKNCIFTNGMTYGIRGSLRLGEVKVLNNLFVSCGYSAIEIYGKSAKSTTDSKLEFANNTVLFTWSRTKEMSDMGYGVRFMTGIINDFHDNIIGLSCFGGIDRTRIDSDKKRETQRIQNVDNNIFFLNKKGDMVMPSGGGSFLWITAEQFEDIEDLNSVDGNIELSTNEAEKMSSLINKAYLEAFLSATYSEELNHNPNSSANQLSRALGGNQSGTMRSKVSMFGNWYPLEEAMKLINIIPEKGMQKIK